MENRLCLNKRVVYELPDEVLIGLYDRGYVKPNFKPNLCLCAWGGAVGRICKPKETAKQIWIKTDNNKDLIDFITNYNWSKEAHKMATPNLNIWKFKKNNTRGIL